MQCLSSELLAAGAGQVWASRAACWRVQVYVQCTPSMPAEHACARIACEIRTQSIVREFACMHCSRGLTHWMHGICSAGGYMRCLQASSRQLTHFVALPSMLSKRCCHPSFLPHSTAMTAAIPQTSCVPPARCHKTAQNVARSAEEQDRGSSSAEQRRGSWSVSSACVRVSPHPALPMQVPRASMSQAARYAPNLLSIVARGWGPLPRLTRVLEPDRRVTQPGRRQNRTAQAGLCWRALGVQHTDASTVGTQARQAQGLGAA